MNDTENNAACTLDTPPRRRPPRPALREAEASNVELRALFGGSSSRGAGAAHGRRQRRLPPSSTAAPASSTWPSAPATARLLYLLGRAAPAPAPCVEFGTSFGVSKFHPPRGRPARQRRRAPRRDFELEPASRPPGAPEPHRGRPRRPGSTCARATRSRTLARDLRRASSTWCSLDGHKPLYPRVLDLVAPRLRPARVPRRRRQRFDASPACTTCARAGRGRRLPPRCHSPKTSSSPSRSEAVLTSSRVRRSFPYAGAQSSASDDRSCTQVLVPASDDVPIRRRFVLRRAIFRGRSRVLPGAVARSFPYAGVVLPCRRSSCTQRMLHRPLRRTIDPTQAIVLSRWGDSPHTQAVSALRSGDFFLMQSSSLSRQARSSSWALVPARQATFRTCGWRSLRCVEDRLRTLDRPRAEDDLFFRPTRFCSAVRASLCTFRGTRTIVRRRRASFLAVDTCSSRGVSPLPSSSFLVGGRLRSPSRDDRPPRRNDLPSSRQTLRTEDAARARRRGASRLRRHLRSENASAVRRGRSFAAAEHTPAQHAPLSPRPGSARLRRKRFVPPRMIFFRAMGIVSRRNDLPSRRRSSFAPRRSFFTRGRSLTPSTHGGTGPAEFGPSRGSVLQSARRAAFQAGCHAPPSVALAAPAPGSIPRMDDAARTQLKAKIDQPQTVHFVLFFGSLVVLALQWFVIGWATACASCGSCCWRARWGRASTGLAGCNLRYNADPGAVAPVVDAGSAARPRRPPGHPCRHDRRRRGCTSPVPDSFVRTAPRWPSRRSASRG